MTYISRLCIYILVAGCLLSCSAPGTSSNAHPAPTSTAAPNQASDPSAAYCTQKGGTVVTRYPTYNTNNDPSTWVRMNGALAFCEFAAQDGSHMIISADTLWSDKPTLATLAYLEKPAQQATNDSSANPSSRYCSQLGGTDLWGGAQHASGGGWTTENTADPFQVANICVFPDRSMIDSWGLTYHTNGIIRGVDLKPFLRYTPTDLPRIFR